MMLSKNIQLLLDNGIKVYPEIEPIYSKLVVEVFDEFKIVHTKKITTSEITHTSATINKALENTVNYIADKLTTLHAKND